MTTPARLLSDAALPGDWRHSLARAADKLRAAAAGFAAAWARPRKRWRNENLRVLEALVTLAFCAMFVGVGAFYDAEAARWAATLPPAFVRVFRVITDLGLSGYMFVLTGGAALWCVLACGRGQGGRADAALAAVAGRATYLFVVLLASGLVSQLVKHLFGRARPSLMSVVGPMHFDAFSLSARYASFPSGHAVTAFAMATGLGFLAPRLRAPLYAVALLVGISRVIVGAHYPSDVIAGAGIGYGAAVLARRAFAARRIVFDAAGGAPRLRGPGVARWLYARLRARRA